MSAIGARIPQLHWPQITSGIEKYSADIDLGGRLVAAVLRSPYPHAQIRSIDTTDAEKIPGVRAVVTAADLPPSSLYMHHGGPLADRPPLARGVVRFIGQEVAAVAAETPEAADEALAAIRVCYRRLPAPVNLVQARRTRHGLHPRDFVKPTVALQKSYRWGDSEMAQARELVAVDGRFTHQRQTHTCLEPNTTLARWDDRLQRLELWTSTQAPQFQVREVAHALGLDEAQVVCREVGVGGGFGSKGKISEHEVIAAVLARKAGRPVLLALSRDEEFSTTKTRHRFETQLRLAADANGRLCSVQAAIDVENGAYNHTGPSVMIVGSRVLGEIYEPIGVSVDAQLIDTATVPGGQFRGYGKNQTVFALECLVDELAEKMGVDPVAFRMHNVNRPNTTTLAGAKLHTVRLAECIERAAAEIGWSAKRGRMPWGRGCGLAVASDLSGAWSYAGADRSEATVNVCENGVIRVHFGSGDAGTGQRTVLAQVVAEEFGVEPARIQVEMIDSESTPFDLGAYSSRGTQMGGHAAANAAAALGDQLRELAAAKLGRQVCLQGGDAVADNGDRIALADLVRVHPDSCDGRLSATAEYTMPEDVERLDPTKSLANYTPSHGFAAHAVEVAVDERTGEVTVLDYVAVHDSGKILNPLLAEGQVIGGVVQGLGAALGEEVIHEGGRMVNPAFISYAVPRAADVPAVRVVLLDGFEPRGPHGAKGIGEIPIVPPAPAVANAVYDAVGIRIRDLPITPDKVLSALAEQRGRRVAVAPVWKRPHLWYISGMRWAYPRGIKFVLERFGKRFSRPPCNGTVMDSAPADLGQLVRSYAEFEPVAGGTDVLPRAARGLAKSPALVSLHCIDELRGIVHNDDGSIRLGAMVTLNQAAADIANRVPVLDETIQTIASPQIRNMATLGGNLLQEKRCWFYRNDFDCYKRGGVAQPCYAILGDHRFYHAAMGGHRCQAVTPSDLATTLVALDARVTIRRASGEKVSSSVADLYTGPGETRLSFGDILTEILLPPQARRRTGRFEKLSLWYGDFAIVSVAITRLDGQSPEARVVIGGLAPTPWRSLAAEKAINEGGDVVNALANELALVAHPLANNGWKLDATVGLLERALDQG